jgi:hypothetical protein
LFLGVIHTALTPVFHDEFAPDALRFAGTGLALVFLGLLNIMAERTFEPWMLNIGIAANLVGSIWAALVAIALPEIQAFLSLIIFLAVPTNSVLVRLKEMPFWRWPSFSS